MEYPELIKTKINILHLVQHETKRGYGTIQLIGTPSFLVNDNYELETTNRPSVVYHKSLRSKTSKEVCFLLAPRYSFLIIIHCGLSKNCH